MPQRRASGARECAQLLLEAGASQAMARAQQGGVDDAENVYFVGHQNIDKQRSAFDAMIVVVQSRERARHIALCGAATRICTAERLLQLEALCCTLHPRSAVEEQWAGRARDNLRVHAGLHPHSRLEADGRVLE